VSQIGAPINNNILVENRLQRKPSLDALGDLTPVEYLQQNAGNSTCYCLPDGGACETRFSFLDGVISSAPFLSFLGLRGIVWVGNGSKGISV
jgi:hypothetical protein